MKNNFQRDWYELCKRGVFWQLQEDNYYKPYFKTPEIELEYDKVCSLMSGAYRISLPPQFIEKVPQKQDILIGDLV
jgi:hypothetical protein